MVLAHDIQHYPRTNDVQINENVSFDTMLLASNTLKGLSESGFYKPSPIQLHGIPLGKCGFDLLLEAKSGTGKTVVFSVIALEKLIIDNGLQVLILAPTREIAAQICDVIKEIGTAYEGLVVEVVMGGLSLQDDIAKFEKHKKVHIVVGSPGRLKHLIQDNYIDTSRVRLLVLDEADKLMEKSFHADINYIFATLPQQKQVIMSSATYPEISKQLINKYMVRAQHVCPNNTNILLGIEQKATVVQYNSNVINQTKIRYKELLKIFSQIQFKQCLIFCNYQARVNELHKMLLKDKWPTEQLYGLQDQTDRLDAIKTLKEFKCRILIATDLAARGIDACNVDLVISFEPPMDWTTYLHRIGRAGRYGSHGIAITIISTGNEETNFKKMLKNILKDSFNIHNLWSKKIINLDNVKPTSDIGKNSEFVQIENSLVNMEKCDINYSEFYNEILYHGHTNIKNEENANDIETFNSLLDSFENNIQNDVKDITYNVIEIKEANTKKLLDNFELDLTLSKMKPAKQYELLSHGNYNGESKTNNKIVDAPTILTGNEILYSLEHNTDINKSQNTFRNGLSNKHNAIIQSDATLSNDNNYDKEYFKYSLEAMAEAGLPTSFASSRDIKKSNTLKKRKENFKNKYQNHPPSHIEKECSEHESVNYKNNNQNTNYDNDDGNYITKHNSNKRVLKKPTKVIKEYIQWHKELKWRVAQINYTIYINEMSKM